MEAQAHDVCENQNFTAFLRTQCQTNASNSHAVSLNTSWQRKTTNNCSQHFFDWERSILELVYKSLIESVLSFNIVTWFGILGMREKAKLNRIVNLAGKVIGRKQKPLSQIYSQYIRKKSKKIISDAKHPMNNSFQFLRSGRRLRAPTWKRNLYRFSFVPSAVRILNSDVLV